ncbi:MAG TPA: metalloprotease family protein [Candidatus Dormibacteraeota bacterium]|nr:metalloprotease family protein [Candidatus Dormibacteraeota bacterium]
MIWLFLAFVLVAHEASHALALWCYRVRFAPRVWYSRDFPWLGFGWMYFVDGIDPRQRRTILVVGPIVEAILWCLGALLFPEYFLGLIVMAGVTLLLNRVVPGGDLWKARRITKAAQPSLAGADPAPAS